MSDKTTPTEQDNEQRFYEPDDIDDLVVWTLPCADCGEVGCPYMYDEDRKELEERLRALITADRKRVELNARLDEIKLTKDNSEESYLGEDWWADESIKDNSAHEVPLSYFENRIAELKAQQEEV